MALAPGTYAVFTTTEGKITVRLFEADAPITVKNFIELAEGAKEWSHPVTRAKSKDKLFHGTIFHRVIPDFMIQGGDPAGTGMGGPGYRFEDETKGSPHKFDKPGKLAMANSGPNTNGSQFFITVARDAVAHRQPHHLRRSGRGPGRRDQDLEGAAQRAGQAAQAGGAGVGRDRARGAKTQQSEGQGPGSGGGLSFCVSMLTAMRLTYDFGHERTRNRRYPQPSLRSMRPWRRLRDILEAKGVTLFALVDHSGEAAESRA